MTREELINLGTKIINFKGSEEEHTALLHLFDKNVPRPSGSSLFYYPENFNFRTNDRSKYNPNVEEVVDKCLSYKSIQL